MKKPKDLKNVICPQCGKGFPLEWDDYTKRSLIVRSCPSGGIYDVTMRCPHCDYEDACEILRI